MYPRQFANTHPDRLAFIMAETGQGMTYAELDAASSRLAHYLRSVGLVRLDHFSILMENNLRFIECCAAGERSGLYFTAINSHLTAPEVAYILRNSQSKMLITSAQSLEIAREALALVPEIDLCLVVDGPGDGALFHNLDDAVSAFPSAPIPDESIGTAMLYSSGTTGRPKGILRSLPMDPPSHPLPVFTFFQALLQCREGMVYLSPAPLYHSAPNTAVGVVIRSGGTAIIMNRFDPENFLRLVEAYGVTHSQLVPTMFSRLLKLPDEVRHKYRLSTLKYVVHAAAPCPAPVKAAMIEWWGPIVHEYYGATESIGFASSNSEEWLEHPGTVGKVLFGELHILDDDMNPVPVGETGTIWFKTAHKFEYFQDPEKTREVTSPDGSMYTVGDVGRVDDEGFLYLTDRKAFMIIAGGVNIYPQECEDLLIAHPKVFDAAVFGIPNPDLGEEVKAVIQPMPAYRGDPNLQAELIAYCQSKLARYKCPRTVDFVDELPRLPTGKLHKRLLRDEYWPEGAA